MMKRPSIVRVVKVIICLLTPTLLSLNGIGVSNIDKKKSASREVDDTLRIVITSDLLLDRGVRQKIDMVGVDALFSPTIDSLFYSSNCVIANLEYPMTKIRERVSKRFIFRGGPEWSPSLRRHGITHLSLANNHGVDQGRRGLLDTQEQIKEAGMIPIGAGKNMEEAAESVLISTSPRHVWVVSSLRLSLENLLYPPQKPCVSRESIDSLTMRVKCLRTTDKNCYILFILHWGWEHHFRATPRQREDAHKLMDAGADAIVGHHSHTLQALDTYREKPIYYGIGNFVFDQRKPMNPRTCLVELSIAVEKCKAKALPIEIKNCTPYLSK